MVIILQLIAAGVCLGFGGALGIHAATAVCDVIAQLCRRRKNNAPAPNPPAPDPDVTPSPKPAPKP